MSKLSPELNALYEEYSAAKSPADFHSQNTMIRVIGDRVLIDAVASADVADLKSDLTTLGMKDAVAFGRMISGQLPISALPALVNLPSLQFARAAGGITRGDRQPIVPPGS
jgi:hypothetical protein